MRLRQKSSQACNIDVLTAPFLLKDKQAKPVFSKAKPCKVGLNLLCLEIISKYSWLTQSKGRFPTYAVLVPAKESW